MRGWLAGLLCGLVAGCSLIREVPPRQSFLLSQEEEPQRRTRAGGQVLNVRPAFVEAAFNDVQFVYRTGENAFQSDFYHFFLSPPGTMITQMTRAAMLGSGVFEEVLAPGAPLRATAALTIEVNEFYGDFREDVTPAAVVAMRMVLKSRDRQRKDPWIDKTYSARIPLSERTPEGLVNAWNQGVTGILEDLARDARRRVPDLPAPTPTPKPIASPTPKVKPEPTPEPDAAHLEGEAPVLRTAPPSPTPARAETESRLSDGTGG